MTTWWDMRDGSAAQVAASCWMRCIDGLTRASRNRMECCKYELVDDRRLSCLELA